MNKSWLKNFDGKCESSFDYGDVVRSISPLLKGKVPVNTYGIVLEAAYDGKHALVEFKNGIRGWINSLELDFCSSDNTSKNRTALDDFGKKYLLKGLDKTGLDKQFLRLAFSDIEKLISNEDNLTPIKIRESYRNLGKKYKVLGGLDFVRAARNFVINKKKFLLKER